MIFETVQDSIVEKIDTYDWKLDWPLRFSFYMKKMNKQTVIPLAARKYLCRNVYRIQPDVMMWFALL